MQNATFCNSMAAMVMFLVYFVAVPVGVLCAILCIPMEDPDAGFQAKAQAAYARAGGARAAARRLGHLESDT